MNRSGPPVLAIFLAVIATLFLLAPLGGTARRVAEGGVIESETRFGPFGFMSVKAVLAEPRYELRTEWSGPGLAKTAAAIAGVWGLMIWRIRSRANRAERQ